MDTETLSRRIAGLREECARLGRELVEQGHGLSSEEAFALAGELQGVVNAAEGATAVAGAWGRVETTVRSGRGSGCTRWGSSTRWPRRA